MYYPVEFRKKILEYWLATNKSCRQIGREFGVSGSFVADLVNRYQEAGNIDIKPFKPNKKSALTEEQIDILIGLMIDYYDKPIPWIKEKFLQDTGVDFANASIQYYRDKLKGKYGAIESKRVLPESDLPTNLDSTNQLQQGKWKLTSKEKDILKEIITSNPDSKLREIVSFFKLKTGKEITTGAVCYYRKRINS